MVAGRCMSINGCTARASRIDDRPVSPLANLARLRSRAGSSADARLPPYLRIEAIVAISGGKGAGSMRVRDGMSTTVLSVGPDHTLREAAALMSRRRVGAAVVLDPDGQGPGIIT